MGTLILEFFALFKAVVVSTGLNGTEHTITNASIGTDKCSTKAEYRSVNMLSTELVNTLKAT